MTGVLGEATSLEAAGWERVRAIYEASFPAHERTEWGELKASIEAGERACPVVSVDGRLVGFGVVVPLERVPFALLEYLAIDPAERGRGCGGALLEGIVAGVGSSEARRGLLLEIEPANEGSEDERVLRERRLAFYVRHGATVVPDTAGYRAPDLLRGGAVTYWLLWLPARPGAEAPPAGGELRRAVRAILTQSYGLAGEDPFVVDVVSGLAG